MAKNQSQKNRQIRQKNRQIFPKNRKFSQKIKKKIDKVEISRSHRNEILKISYSTTLPAVDLESAPLAPNGLPRML